MAKHIILFHTADQFIKWVNETFPKTADDDRSDAEYAAWAICLQEAHAISDFTSKDIASLFMDGLPSYRKDPILRIQEWLDNANCDFLNAVQEEGLELPDDNLFDGDLAEEYGLLNIASFVAVDYGSTKEEKHQFD